MNPAVFMLMTATFGVDYGWQVNRDGKLEYIVQLSMESLETLRTNPEGITSLIPPEVQGVRVIRIRVGSNRPPRDPIPPINAGSSTQWNPNAETPFGANNARVNLANQNFAGGINNEPLLVEESSMTPLGNGGFTGGEGSALPGPVDGIDDPQNAVDELRNSTNPRATTVPVREFGGGGTIPRAEINRNSLDRIQPNTRAPDPYVGPNINPGANYGTDYNANHVGPQTGQYGDFFNGPAGARGGYDPRTTSVIPPPGTTSPNNGYYNNGQPASPNPYYSTNGNYRLPAFTGTQQAVLLFLLLLCLSVGVNVFLGWVAWDYYLRYRDALDQWRSSNYTPST